MVSELVCNFEIFLSIQQLVAWLRQLIMDLGVSLSKSFFFFFLVFIVLLYSIKYFFFSIFFYVRYHITLFFAIMHGLPVKLFIVYTSKFPHTNIVLILFAAIENAAVVIHNRLELLHV